MIKIFSFKQLLKNTTTINLVSERASACLYVREKKTMLIKIKIAEKRLFRENKTKSSNSHRFTLQIELGCVYMYLILEDFFSSVDFWMDTTLLLVVVVVMVILVQLLVKKRFFSFFFFFFLNSRSQIGVKVRALIRVWYVCMYEHYVLKITAADKNCW